MTQLLRFTITSPTLDAGSVLSSTAHPRPLHSFPTRRSSDLPRTGRCASRDRSPTRTPRSSSSSIQSPHASCAPSRSEEHTSELQSRQYLVCRLVLEKKKWRKQHGAIEAETVITALARGTLSV